MHNIFLIRRRFGQKKGNLIILISMIVSIVLLLLGLGLFWQMA